MSDGHFDNMTTANTTSESVTLDLLENLIPALLKVFMVVLIGYVFGRTGIYPTGAARNLAKLCGELLLPVYAFNAMASISVTPEAWDFLYAVIISKTTVFLAILVLVLCVDRARGRIGRAAISAVFCTQSNDFALGIPIFQVIYSTTNPGYRFLLYIVAPVNYMFLNPIGECRALVSMCSCCPCRDFNSTANTAFCLLDGLFVFLALLSMFTCHQNV